MAQAALSSGVREKTSFVARRRSDIHEFRKLENVEREETKQNYSYYQRRGTGGVDDTISRAMSHARSLPSLRGHPGESENTTNDPMRGFCIGDKVISTGGYDQTAPWAQMGCGSVVGPDKKKGYLIVYFEKTDEHFRIKASNLRNLTRRVEHRTGLQRSYSQGGFQKQLAGKRKNRDTTISIESRGLEIGDVVTDNLNGGFCTVMGVESLGVVRVLYDGLGTTAKVKVGNLSKSARLSSCSKESCKIKGRAPSTPTYKRKIAEFTEHSGLVSYLQPEEAAPIKNVPAVSYVEECHLERGMYVKVTNGTFEQFGLGLIRALSKESGMAKVQFQSGGETWAIRLEDLEAEDAPGIRFRPPGMAAQQTDVATQEKRNARRHAQQEKAKALSERNAALALDRLADLKAMAIENEFAEDHHTLGHF